MRTSTLSSSPGDIEQRLSQMMSHATEIEKGLLEAPLSLTGSKEPFLFDTIQRIKRDLQIAQQAWSK